MILHNICPEEVKWNQITQGTEKKKEPGHVGPKSALCFVFWSFWGSFPGPKLDVKGKRREANEFSSNEGESKETDGFYLKKDGKL